MSENTEDLQQDHEYNRRATDKSFNLGKFIRDWGSYAFFLGVVFQAGIQHNTISNLEARQAEDRAKQAEDRKTMVEYMKNSNEKYTEMIKHLSILSGEVKQIKNINIIKSSKDNTRVMLGANLTMRTK